MTVWSYSSLNAFEQCPRRYAVIRVYKSVKESQTQAMLHGNEVHKALELYGKGEAPLPERYNTYKPLVDAIISAPGSKAYETKFALTEDLKPTTFFAKDCWVRGVLDVKVVNPPSAVVCDYKLGKPRSDSSQLELFAAATLALHPEVDKVRTGYAWLAHNMLDRADYPRTSFTPIWDSFRVRVERLDRCTKLEEWDPKPSGLCRNHCPVPKTMCEFSGKT